MGPADQDNVQRSVRVCFSSISDRNGLHLVRNSLLSSLPEGLILIQR
jgi:hypothetical protein